MIAGFACHARGVEIEAADAKSARAVVKSKRVHTVDLRAKDGTLAAQCSCPADEMGTFPCKHVWAALLEIDKLGGLADLRAKRGPLTVIRKPASRPKARKPKRRAQPPPHCPLCAAGDPRPTCPRRAQPSPERRKEK